MGSYHNTSFYKILLSVTGLGLLLGCSAHINNKQERQQFEILKAGYPVSVAESGDAKVDALVRQLVSKRPAPFHTGFSDPPGSAVFADMYCTPEVAAAMKQLKQLGPKIFPTLVKHLGDDRYSYSDVVAAWENHTVGDAVVEIFDDGFYMHSGYKSRKTPSNSGGIYLSFHTYLRARGAETWAEWASNKSRLEIQLDFIDWCFATENERGYTDEEQKIMVLETYQKARLQMEKWYSKNGNAVK